METVHIIIKGKVQGVFYRATAKEIADEVGIKGWVKKQRRGICRSCSYRHKRTGNKFYRLV